jgi:anti-sigma B factor antagonist
METVIGVFSSRDHAEKAITELRGHLSEDSIVFLTRSENEATQVVKELGAVVGGIAGGATGLYAGIIASLLVPGLGPVFAIGAGAAALLGLAGAGGGSAIGKMVAHDSRTAATPDEQCSEDILFFHEVLQAGRSLIIVRTESKEIAALASGILDRLGIAMPEKTPARMQTATRQLDGATVVDVSGRITLGEGNVILREVVRELVNQGNTNIILNLAEVHYVDSSGLGELVKTLTTVRNRGGKLTLANPNQRILHLLELTKLTAIFDIEPNEANAIQSFTKDTKSVA